MINFKWAKAVYTGGNIYIFRGETADGRFFLGGDSTYQVFILDANPETIDETGEYEVVSDNPEWLEKHTIEERAGDDYCLDFHEALVRFCLENGENGIGTGDLEADLKEIEELRKTPNWW